MVHYGSSSGRRRPPTVPLRFTVASPVPPYISCWYCDCKIYVFNDIIFNLGWRHARYMRAWFSVGAYFSLIALVGISVLHISLCIIAAIAPPIVFRGKSLTGILAAIKTFSHHAIIGIFCFVRFALFCLETLVSISVLQKVYIYLRGHK